MKPSQYAWNIFAVLTSPIWFPIFLIVDLGRGLCGSRR